jgi:adenylate cyclase
MGKNRKMITLRISISTTFVGVVLLSCTLLGILTFINVRDFIRQGIAERLHDDISIGVQQLNPEIHKKLVKPSDEGSPAYLRLKHTLQKIRNNGTDIRYVYTMRKLDNGKLIFVVDAEENPTNMSHLGDIYDKPTPELLASFEKPYRAHVEKTFSSDEWGTWLSSYYPIITKEGKVDGILGMDISAKKIVHYEEHYFLLIFAIFIFITLFVIFIAIFFAGRISNPMLLLEKDLSKVQKFDLTGKIDIKSNIKEVNIMKEAIEDMKNGLKSFKKYVPSDLVAELIRLNKEAVLGAEKRFMTVSFSDIADFTSISETLPPERLIENLGVYFEGMTGTILKNKGTIDKYIGDAIMSFWGAPNFQENHAVLACISALESQRFLDMLTKEWNAKGFPLFKTRFGINTGELIVGNMGYEQRLNYTVMGDTVNLASRLEGLNKFYGTRIIISEFTRESVSNAMEVRHIDTVAVKGKKQGVKIFELVSEKGNIGDEARDFVNLCNNGMDHYEKNDWHESVKVFEEALNLRPEDKPVQMALERCRKFEAEGTPPGWNGVTVFHEK